MTTTERKINGFNLDGLQASEELLAVVETELRKGNNGIVQELLRAIQTRKEDINNEAEAVITKLIETHDCDYEGLELDFDEIVYDLKGHIVSNINNQSLEERICWLLLNGLSAKNIYDYLAHGCRWVMTVPWKKI